MTVVLKVLQKQIYGQSSEHHFVQKVGFWMVVGHYLKRELETLFVHRFSNDTMPFLNVFKNSAHYWAIFGFLCMYFFLHPKYTPAGWSDNQIIGFAGVFTLWEFLNLMTHITLRNLRPPGSTERRIPHGWGFDQVSCANYLWECLAWITFAIMSKTAGAWFFVFVSVGQMVSWAVKKHKRYRQDFKDYPK